MLFLDYAIIAGIAVASAGISRWLYLRAKHKKARSDMTARVYSVLFR